jgi:hypothetical protein
MTHDPQNEPEQYSLDEMMRRLKERGHDEGELVTRADGTVAVKVRKRKRRSKQPHKEEAKRQQRLRVVQLAGLFLLFTAIIAFAVGMLLYYNSSAFRESTREKIAAWSAAEVEMAEFTVSPNNARFATANFTWPEGNYLRQLQLQHASAHLDLSSFFGSKWGGNSVVVKTGNLIFSSAKPDAPKRSGSAPEGAFPFSFQNYRCENLTIAGLRDDKLPWLSVEKTESTITKSHNGAQVRFIGGTMNIAGFQPMLIDRGTLWFENNQIKVEIMRLRPTAGEGTLELQNHIDLYSKERSKLEVLLTGFPLELLLGNDLNLLVIGKVDTPPDAINRLISFVPGDFSSLQAQIGFRGSARDALTLINLPFLEELSRELRNPEFAKQYVFSDRVEGVFLRDALSSRIQGLLLEKKGQFIVRGDIIVDNGKLGGILNIGLPSSQLVESDTNPALKSVFQRQEDGYLWCRIELSGTPGQPRDNFATQLEAALAASPAPSTSAAPTPPSRELDIEKELDGE